MHKKRMDKKVEKCDICEKKATHNYSVGGDEILHACFKHSRIVMISAMTLANKKTQWKDFYAE